MRIFLRWCVETGSIPSYRDAPVQRILRSYPPVYGKTQDPHPPNRLDAEQYQRLITACQDGSDAGLRDELMVRLGVSGGMRVTELRTLTVAHVRSVPRLAWIGKAGKPRTAIAGPDLCDLITHYLARYTAALAHPPTDSLPLLCPNLHKSQPGVLRWGVPTASNDTLSWRLRNRCAAAGLGYMAPHDLKRTAARMMHEARSTDGGHIFDLLDIAEVLDHDNPKVTKDCYIGPLGSDNKQRAAALFG